MAQLPNLPGFIRDKSGRLSVDKQATWVDDDDGGGYYDSDQGLLGKAYGEYYERTNLPRGQLGGGNYIDRTYEQNEAGDDVAKYSLRYAPPPSPAPSVTPGDVGMPPAQMGPYPTPQPAPKGPATPVPSWVTPPPHGSGTLQALETLTNPVTGETYTAPTSGYTVNIPAQQPTPAPQPAYPDMPERPTTPFPGTTQGPENLEWNRRYDLYLKEQGLYQDPRPPAMEKAFPGFTGRMYQQGDFMDSTPFTPEFSAYLKENPQYSVEINPEQPYGQPIIKKDGKNVFDQPIGPPKPAPQPGGIENDTFDYKRIFDIPGPDDYRNMFPDYQGPVLMAEAEPGKPYGHTQFTPEFTEYYKSKGYTLNVKYSAGDGPAALYDPEGNEVRVPRRMPVPGGGGFRDPVGPQGMGTPRPTPEPPVDMEKKVVGETAAQAGIGTVPPELDPQTRLTYIPKQFEEGEAYRDVQDFVNLEGNVVIASTTGLEVPAPPRINAQTYSAYVQEGTPEYAAAQGQPSSESLIGDIQGAVSQESIAQAAVGELDEKATVKYQMDQLFDSFEEGKPPPAWAAPAVRKVGSMMAQRGLGKSSMAAAAITQAMMESGIQIAAQDANKYATIQLNNLNNQQKTSLQNAMTFAAMDKANLDARMQAAVNNSRVFLEMDTANLTNQQQLKTIDLQQQYQKMFNDNAQENASRQFNAKSQMQVDQFFTELDTQVANANVSRMAAMDQFNADQVNAADRYYAKLNDAREKLNVQLDAQISQANTNWRRQINTANTAEQNRVNQQNALNLLEIQQSSMDKIWQRYRDEAQWALTVSENNAQRAHNAALFAQSNEFNAAQYEKESKDFMYTAMGSTVLNGIFHLIK